MSHTHPLYDRAAFTRLLGAGFALLLMFAGAGRAGAQEPPTPDPAAAWARCWIQQNGLPPDHVRAAEALLQPAFLVTGYELRGSYPPARAILTESRSARPPLELLIRYEVPLWRAQPVDWATSASTPLSLTHGANACLPYPVKSIRAVPTSVVRGHTVALAIETDRLVSCHYTVFGQTEPCYRHGETDAYLLIGVSALIEPGRYPIDIEIDSGTNQAAFALRLELTPGTYGFQYIDPPASLSQLMDPELMASEAEYLAQWRAIRSSARHWDLPLALPLAQAVPITADYGDRRSYGGAVDGYHSGVDYGAWGGMDVIAPAPGVVVMVESLVTRGNAVLIDHGWGLVTGYWHLSRIDARVGDVLSLGQAFAQVGSTGLSTGAHLHWEVWANGVSVDGKQWLRDDFLQGVTLPPSEPLPASTGNE